MRALVTGGQGFVGRWLCAHLAAAGDDVTVTGSDVDVTDGPALRKAFSDAAPEAVYHLAALSHVGQSWDAPAATFRVNALGTLEVLEAARACVSDPTVLVVSSAEVYGWVTPEQLPLDEDAPLRPVTPYAASKVAAEFCALQAHLGHGVAAVRARSFNHVGPGQAPSFVVAGLASRLVEAERSGSRVIRVGNLDARRDITDVRDVVRAYRLLVERGQAGEAYNVCSGRDVGVGEVLARLMDLAGGHFTVETDAEMVRPVDVPVLRGDPSRLGAATGWSPEVSLDETLAAVLDDWRGRS